MMLYLNIYSGVLILLVPPVVVNQRYAATPKRGYEFPRGKGKCA